MNRLKILRKEKHLRQEDLAKLIGVDRTTIAKWETGRVQPRLDRLLKMAEVFECTVDELLADLKK